MKIGIVSDSTADIPAALAEQHDIEIIPAQLYMDNRSYVDGVEISREEFYTRLPTLVPPPTTASPSVGSFHERYEKILQRGAGAIVSIHPPNVLSGIFNAARIAAEAFNGRVKVLDGGQVSLGLGFQAIMAAEAASHGAGLTEMLALLESIRARVRLVALLDSLEYIHRSGRVSWAMARIGALLHLRPLVELRFGIVSRLGQVRTRLKGVENLLEEMNSWGMLERLAVLHTNAESAARTLLEKVKSKVTIPPLLVNVTTVIGTHVGPNGLGLTAVPVRA